MIYHHCLTAVLWEVGIKMATFNDCTSVTAYKVFVCRKTDAQAKWYCGKIWVHMHFIKCIFCLNTLDYNIWLQCNSKTCTYNVVQGCWLHRQLLTSRYQQSSHVLLITINYPVLHGFEMHVKSALYVTQLLLLQWMFGFFDLQTLTSVHLYVAFLACCCCDRFMESEVELNDTIQEMHVIATVPHLYHTLVELNSIQSLLQLLNHDNTGNVLTTVGVVVYT